MLISPTSKGSYPRPFALFVLLFCLIAPYGIAARPADPQTERAASGVVGTLASGQYDAVVANFSDRLRREMPAAKVAQLWQAYLNQYGYYQGQLGSGNRSGAVIIRCQMQKGAIDVQIVYDSDGRISGFGINPIDTSLNIKPPT
jgi:hypothetical protein